MMAFSDTGELIVENAELPPHFGGDVLKAEAVVLNIDLLCNIYVALTSSIEKYYLHSTI